MVIDEVEIARVRIDLHTHTQTVMMQAAMAASQSKKAFSPFKKLLEKLLP